MMLFLLRHADAEDFASSDFDRALTAKGLEQSAKVGKFCSRNGLRPGLILSSPVVRAIQTAGIVGEALDMEPVVEPSLACGMAPSTLLRVLAAHTRLDSVMVVGHEPDLGNAASNLIGLADPCSILVRKASLTAIDIPWLEAGGGQLHWSVPVRLM
jgi:phosphohistidine phosphatase